MTTQYEQKKIMPKIISSSKSIVKYPSYSSSSSSLFSEVISKCIIERLISLTISQTYIKQLEPKVCSFCSDFTKKILNSYIKSQFISYDYDESKTTTHSHSLLSSNLSKIVKESQKDLNNSPHNNNLLLKNNFLFFNNFRTCDNNWSLPSEPPPNKVDRYASTFISYQPDKIKEDKEGNQNGNENYKENIKINNIINPLKLKAQKQPSMGKVDLNEKGKKKKKNLIDIMNEMSVYDLPKEANVSQTEKGIDYVKLRKEKEEELKKEKAKKDINQNKENETQEQLNKEKQKKNKLTNKQFTIDSKGNIVIIKKINLQELKNEFITIKTQCKNVFQKQGSIFNKAKEKDQVIINAPSSNNTITNQNTNTLISKDSTKETLPEIPIKVKKTQMNKQFLPQSRNRDKIKDNLTSPNIDKKLNKGIIIPSGSCFDRITLEVGVKYIENSKMKTGGTDFFRKYNKYSVESYNKKLKDTNYANSINNLNSQLCTQTNFNIDTISRRNLLESVGNNLYAPNQTSSNIFHNRALSYTNTTGNFSKMNKTNYNGLIKLNSVNQNALHTAMEELDFLQEIEIEETTKKGENILKAQKFKKDHNSHHTYSKSQVELGQMNKFTKTILQSEKWGEDNISKRRAEKTLILPKKPMLNEVRVNKQKSQRERNFFRSTTSKFSF